MKKTQLELREDLQNYFADKDAFEEIMLLSGETVRKRQGRHTFSFSVMGKKFFIKQHRGVGWREILKNLLQLRLPILGASNEWCAIKRLHELGIDTMTLAGYGQRGKNPAKLESFVITDALENTTTLAVLVEEWIKNPPPVRLKYALIYKVAKITRALHENGINHRDLYICHFRLPHWVLEKQVFDDPPLFLMDLHRAQIRPKTPMRWIIKDLGALYFSSADIGLTQRDFFRFIKTYHDTDLRTVFSQYPGFWQKVQKRAKRFYRRDMRREMPVFCTPKKTIIVHLINLDTVGGVERLYCQVINANIKDVEHHTISCRNTIASVLWQDVKKASKSIHFEKKVYALKVPKWPVFLRKKHLNNLMQKIVPDIVIVWNNPEGFDLSLLPLKTKVFYYEHGGAWNNHNPEKVYRFINNVTGIICNSYASQKLLELKWQVSRKVNYHICLNAIPPDCLPAEFNSKKFNKTFNLGVAARLVSYKGISLAIYAIKELKTRNIPCHLFIAGIGPEQRKLQSLTSQLDLENEIEFCNLVNNMSQFYQNIDCFLCPSIREPFGLVVAEAMAHGCPVIVAAVDGLPEVVTHNKNGFCIVPSLAVEQYAQLGGTNDQLPEYVYNPKTDKIEAPKLVDPIALADKIQVLCSQPTLYERMSQAAIKSAQTEFEFGNYIDHFYAILRNDEVQGTLDSRTGFAIPSATF